MLFGEENRTHFGLERKPKKGIFRQTAADQTEAQSKETLEQLALEH